MNESISRQIITLTGPSAAGKTTVMKELLSTGRYSHLRSFTTRPPRPGEVDGVDYDFLTRKDARKLIAAGQTLESVEFRGHFYGTSIQSAEEALASGLWPIKVVEPTGVVSFREKQKLVGFKLFAVYMRVCEGVIADRMINRAMEEFQKTGKVSEMTRYRIRHAIEVEAKQWAWRTRYNITIDADRDFNEVMSIVARKFIKRGVDPYLTKYLR